CCGANFPLKLVCEQKGLDLEAVIRDLNVSVRNTFIPNTIRFEDWDIGFLTEYIIHLHHQYLKMTLPDTRDMLHHFTEDHRKKFPYLDEVDLVFSMFVRQVLPNLEMEEAVIFPYIRQLSYAYNHHESYSRLLVQTLAKPVEKVIRSEQELVETIFFRLRGLTHDYLPPEHCCTTHRVILHLLGEIDRDFVHHVHLEINILFPRAIAMEAELAKRN
ncbi:MAG: hypothetical protein ACYCOO_06210, partial [Chitinophagaceae bacterium]